MQTPGMSPMLHSVYALTVIDELTGLGQYPKRTPLLRSSQYGDVRNVTCPTTGKSIPIPLDQQLSVNFVIPNTELGRPASHIWERYIEPASREMADQILEQGGSYRCFARMELPPADMGVKSFRADHNDMSVLCTLGYDMKARGVECQLDVLYGWFGEI